MQKIVSEFHQESVQKRKTVFKIAYFLAWNFQIKFKNYFKPKYRQNVSEKCLFFENGTKFLAKNLSAIFATKPKSPPQIK
jgi:hypothetical protein